MDRNMMSIYGWILIAVLCMGVLIAFATPFGKFTMEQITYTVEDMVDKVFDDGSEKPALDKPSLALNGNILTITPVDKATSYELYIGNRCVQTLTDNLTVDLNNYIDNSGIFVVKVIALSSAGQSDVAAIGYRVEFAT